MKLTKLMIVMATFLSFAQGAQAVGPMEKAEIRDGQLICLGLGSGLKESRAPAAVRKDEERRESTNKSAQ